jgi:excisionase family DNA binding protein
VTPSDQILVSVKDVAELLGISVRHLQSLDATGRLGPRGVTLGRSRRFSVNELRRWTAAGCPSREAWTERQEQEAGTVVLQEATTRGGRR